MLLLYLNKFYIIMPNLVIWTSALIGCVNIYHWFVWIPVRTATFHISPFSYLRIQYLRCIYTVCSLLVFYGYWTLVWTTTFPISSV